ncbi:TonB-dependent receptor [Steroidobacter sp. S1-65]|uniref:TonB-dependent receptor n=1 Tax=Steroidobacter gossypii TaxID=2805490 RepID=A0ABS1X0N9_9GAMM|nr:TonB-dependent receptor [Steroidobacter gossypii]MBM0106769.1 TonB-dependent receptor [Steroidobacter gossypii]
MKYTHAAIRARLCPAAIGLCIALPALGQGAANTGDAPQLEEIVVTGVRETQRSSIEMKRMAPVIVDGIVNDEIGALPDNSVGDTLERITGVAADRFKGNANELSVRGLGPALSFSTFNGREVSTAGPDRSVAFQQFPSELVNGVLVYKSQQADFAEGGIAGVIELRSLKPIEFGKRRFQSEVRGVYLPKDDDIDGRDGLGDRANISYIDSFDTAIGQLGVSIGYQHQDQAAPEDYYITNSSFIPCVTSANSPTTITGSAAEQTAAGTSFNCSNAATAAGTSVGPRYFATSSRSFQQKETSEIRDGAIGTLQWKPTDALDITIDGQYSKRDSLELRNMLAITEAARGIRPEIIGGDGNGYSPGSLIRYTGNSNLEVQMERRLREEEYKGGGAAVTWTGERLTVVGDLSYSESRRTELQKATNMRSLRRVLYTLDGSGDEVPTVVFDDFDITDPDNFLIATPANNTNYARYRKTTDRFDEISAARLDFKYALDGFVQAVKVGGRYSEHERTNDANNNADRPIPIAYDGRTPAQLTADANANCRRPFPTSSYMDESSTNVGGWALFDNDCVFRTYTGADSLPLQADSRGPEDTNVTEKITAFYVMSEFAALDWSVPMTGNIGVRYVTTTVDATGYRSEVAVTPSVGGAAATITVIPGTLSTISDSADYDYFLPSLNLSFDLSDVTKLRFAAYRALSRVGIEEFNVGITPVADANATTVEGVLANSTTGNPHLKPLTSWNLDASLELYLSQDTLVSFATYYKWLKGAAFDAVQPLPTTIIANGVPVTFNAIAPANDPERRRLYGFELTGSHAFTWLPSPFDGFGVSGGYNYVDADFEFPDPSAVGPYVSPANLRGLSRHSANGSVYWEKNRFSIRASYVYRSDYSKPNSNTNRSVDGSGYLNMSAQYDVTDYLQLKVQALNLTDTRDIMYKPGEDAITEVSESGPAYYFGARLRF